MTPYDPKTATLMMAATGLHELYLSYVKAGFTPAQAFELVKVVLSEVSRPAPKEST